MSIIEIKTLVDVTNTRARRSQQGTQDEINQYRNWTTLLQCIGLRANIELESEDPQVEYIPVAGLGFGKKYTGTHRVWTIRFTPERESAYDNGDDHIGLLRADLDMTPVIFNLTETINIQKAVMMLNDPAYTNVVVKEI